MPQARSSKQQRWCQLVFLALVSTSLRVDLAPTQWSLSFGVAALPEPAPAYHYRRLQGAGLVNITGTYTYSLPDSRTVIKWGPVPPPRPPPASSNGSAAANASRLPAPQPPPLTVNVVNIRQHTTNDSQPAAGAKRFTTKVFENGKLIGSSDGRDRVNVTSVLAARNSTLTRNSAQKLSSSSRRRLQQFRLGSRFGGITGLSYSYAFSTRRFNVAARSGPAPPPSSASGGGGGGSAGGGGGGGASTGAAGGAGGGAGNATAAAGGGGAGGGPALPALPPIRINVVNVDNTKSARGSSIAASPVSIVTVQQGDRVLARSTPGPSVASIVVPAQQPAKNSTKAPVTRIPQVISLTVP